MFITDRPKLEKTSISASKDTFWEQQGKIMVWAVDKSSGIDPMAFHKILSEEEKSKAQKFVFDKDRSTHILSRGVLRTLLGNYTDTEPDKIKLEYGPYGKPRLKTNNSLKFNVSHSKSIILLAFSYLNDIGVDVEAIQASDDLTDVSKTVYSEDEMEILKPLGKAEFTNLFFDFWTRKEAFIKCTGYGLSMPIGLKAVSTLANEIRIQEKNNATEWQQDFTLKSFIPSDGYRAALSLRGNIASVSYARWPPSTR